MAPAGQQDGEAPTVEDKADKGVSKRALLSALKSLSKDDLKELLTGAEVVPTTMGMTPEAMHVLMGTLTKVSADAQKEAIRSQRRENPSYPERSEFFPAGVFTDDGTALRPKLKLALPTYFQGVRLAGELETEEEIALCNRFTESRYARDGQWSAEIEGQGARKRLLIRVNREGQTLNIDDRMSLPPFTMILRELLEGKEAVNTETLHRQIEAMQAQIAALTKKGAAA